MHPWVLPRDAPHLPLALTLYPELTQAVALVDVHFRVWTPNFLRVHIRASIRESLWGRRITQIAHSCVVCGMGT